MTIYNVHGGHNLIIPGANGIFSEVTEDRKVKDGVISKLRSLGYTVYDCTDDNGKTQNENLKNIVTKCNAHTVDLDISIHFNASDGQGHGVEVLQYSDKTQEVAQSICNEISNLGFKNRGVKRRADLYVLKKTKAPAILVECCFCDSTIDVGIYNSETMVNAIVKGLVGEIKETVIQPTQNEYRAKVTTQATSLRVRDNPNGNDTGKRIAKGETVTVVSENNGWGYVKEYQGWSSLNYLTRITENKVINYIVGKEYKTLVDSLNIRTGAGATYAKKSRSKLTANAQKNCNPKGQLNKNVTVTCKEIKNVGNEIWIRIPSGWVCAFNGTKKYIG